LKAKIPSNGVADDRRWEPVAVVERFRLLHDVILADRDVNVTMPPTLVNLTVPGLHELPPDSSCVSTHIRFAMCVLKG
jgi:hypothetical protein